MLWKHDPIYFGDPDVIEVSFPHKGISPGVLETGDSLLA